MQPLFSKIVLLVKDFKEVLMKKLISVLAIMLVIAMVVACSPADPKESAAPVNVDSGKKEPNKLPGEELTDELRNAYMQLMPKETSHKFNASVVKTDKALDDTSPSAFIIRTLDEYKDFVAKHPESGSSSGAKKLNYDEAFFKENVLVICGIDYDEVSAKPQVVGIVGTSTNFSIGIRTVVTAGANDKVANLKGSSMYKIYITMTLEEAATMETVEILMLKDIG